MSLGYVQNRAIELLKQNFVDCTFGGEDDEKVMYDIGLEETYAHVNIFKSEDHPILVKIYNPESDEEPIADILYKRGEQVVEYLNLRTWRQVWNRRRKIWRADTEEQLEKWISKNKNEYDEPIFIDKHPKDDWVAYFQPTPLKL